MSVIEFRKRYFVARGKYKKGQKASKKKLSTLKLKT
jgi:hypothetical protein